MQIALNSTYYQAALAIVKKLTENGHTAYFAGGWVRDFLMGHASSDIDIATNASIIEITQLFSQTIPVGIAFGVVIVVEKKMHFEVATFRKDLEYENGRSPQKIVDATPQEDASRRDFTINGMFYDPLKKIILDYVGGQNDLSHRIIRTIGIPQERFKEDRLRLIRAVRFACRFDFSIELETEKALKEYANSLFPAVSIERIWQELCKMRAYPRFDQAMILMARNGLLQTIFPVLKELAENQIQFLVRGFSKMPKNTPTILFILKLFPNSSLKQWVEVGKYLKIKNRDIALIEFYAQTMTVLQKEKDQRELAELAHLYAHPDAQLCILVYLAESSEHKIENEMHYHQEMRGKLAQDIQAIIGKKPVVSAKDLLKYGITGKPLGLLLKEAEKIAINQRLHECDAVIVQLKKSPNWP